MLLGLVLLMGQSHDASDRRIVPPVERSFASANARFHLRVFTTDGWKTRGATAELREGRHLLWSKRLPHSQGPRDAVVLDSGGVVLLDEWINVASPQAITIFDPKGEIRTVFSYAQVRDALRVSSDDLSAYAHSGPYGRGAWLGGHPIVHGDTVELSAGGRTLVVDLAKRALRKKG